MNEKKKDYILSIITQTNTQSFKQIKSVRGPIRPDNSSNMNDNLPFAWIKFNTK